ncbi:MAG: GNAT family N-acetyltransferase [Planctomycetota bacterium]
MSLTNRGLLVTPDTRGGGVGRALMEVVIQQARHIGARARSGWDQHRRRSSLGDSHFGSRSITPGPVRARRSRRG